LLVTSGLFPLSVLLLFWCARLALNQQPTDYESAAPTGLSYRRMFYLAQSFAP
jgi:hypothetical protein